MRTPRTVSALDALGRVRLSKSFFLREFLYSEVANFHGLPNIPEDPDLVIEAGRNLCETLLEPLQATFGKVLVRSGYRSPTLNAFCNEKQRAGKAGYTCGSNERNRAHHIWDQRDASGHMGATACIVIPWFADRYDAGADWRALAWYIHDNLPYSSMYFFPKMAAFNLNWCETPERRIDSYIKPRGRLTDPDADADDHGQCYAGFPRLRSGK